MTKTNLHLHVYFSIMVLQITYNQFQARGKPKCPKYTTNTGIGGLK